MLQSMQKDNKTVSDRNAVSSTIRLQKKTIAMLQEWRDCYELAYNSPDSMEYRPVSFDMMITRLLELGIPKVDRDVYQIHEAMKSLRKEKGSVLHFVDPTKGEIWQMRHFFERNGDEIPAIPAEDDSEPFTASYNGTTYSYSEMVSEGFVLMNEGGMEIYGEYVGRVSRILREHGYRL